MRFAQQPERHAEGGVGGLGPGDGLEHEVDRNAAFDEADRRGRMRENAGLGRDGVPLDEVGQEMTEAAEHLG